MRDFYLITPGPGKPPFYNQSTIPWRVEEGRRNRNENHAGLALVFEPNYFFIINLPNFLIRVSQIFKQHWFCPKTYLTFICKYHINALRNCFILCSHGEKIIDL